MAWDTSSLIAFRILQAVGGGIVSPTGMAIVTDVIPPKDRGKAFGLWGMGMMLAPAFGPYISGLIVDNVGDWRPIFLLGVPFGIAGLLAALQYLPKTEDAPHQHTTAFDIIGFSLLSSSLTAFLIPLTQGNRVGWDDAWIRLSFVAAALLFAGFIVRELSTQAPMLDLKIFRDRVFSVATGLRFILGMGYYFSIFLLPLFTQDILGWDATQSGIILMPAGLAMAVLMPIAGILVDKIGARVLIFSGMVLAAYGTLLFAGIDTDWTMQHMIVVNVIRTAALGLLFTPLTTAALVNVPRHRTGAASGILNTIWQVGGSLGIAVGQAYLTSRSAVRLNEVASMLVPERTPVATFFGRLQAMAAAHHWPHGTAHAMLAQIAQGMAVVRAYDDTFLLGAVLIGVSAPLALLLRYKAAMR
jgi:EmrB/QacA subfamily drug resistance transporter